MLLTYYYYPHFPHQYLLKQFLILSNNHQHANTQLMLRNIFISFIALFLEARVQNNDILFQ